MRNFLVILLVLVLVLFAIPPASADEEVLQPPDRDSFVLQAQPDTNFGTVDHFRIGTETGSLIVYRSLIGWDISSININSTIINATAELYMYTGTGFSGDSATMFRSDEDWTEGAVTWNNLPDVNLTDDVSINLPASVPQFVPWNITSQVQKWVNESAPNYGVLVRYASESGADENARFRSKEYSNSGQHPKLTVNFTVTGAPGGPNFTVTTLAATNIDFDSATLNGQWDSVLDNTTIQPSEQDSFIQEGDPDSNFGSNVSVQVAPTGSDLGTVLEFEFVSRTSSDNGTNQAVAYDGTNYFGTHLKIPSSNLEFPWITKFDSDFNVVLERNVTGDGPAEFNHTSGGIHPQVNGMWTHLDDKIYVSAMNWPNTTRLAWVFVYNKSDLEFQEYFDLPDGWSEDIFMDETSSNWWVSYAANPRVERLDLNFENPTIFTLPSEDLDGDPVVGYQGMKWINGRLYGNIHEGNISDVGCADSCMHEYSFSGTEFTAISALNPPTGATTQGFDVLGDTAYFAERNFAANDNRIVTANIINATLYSTPEYNVSFGSEDPATTSHIVDIPGPPVVAHPGRNILVVLLAFSATSTCTFPADFTLLFGGGSLFCYGLKEESAVSENATVTVSSGTSVRSSWGSFRVFGNTWVDTSTFDSDDPPLLSILSPTVERVGTKAGNFRNALWIVSHIVDGPSATPRCTAAPTGYVNFTNEQVGTGVDYTAYCSADKVFQNVTDDPDAWTISGTEDRERSLTWAFWWDSAPANAQIQRALVQFNITTIPSDVEIISATMQLYRTTEGGATADNRTHRVVRITESWDNGTVNWTNQPAVNESGNFTRDIGDVVNVFIDFNITVILNEWYVNETPNYGVMVLDPDTGVAIFVSYSSEENATAADRPTLEVVYRSIAPIDVRFAWGRTTGFGEVTPIDSVAPGTFSATIIDLDPRTQYFFRAIGDDGNDTIFGDTLSFTTIGPIESDTGFLLVYLVAGFVLFGLIGSVVLVVWVRFKDAF